MSFVDSLKKGLFGSEDEYDDQYIDDGPQMVNNNNGLGIGADDEDEDPAEGTPKKNKVVNIHATTQLKVVLVKPERFEDASTIADHLNNKRTVVLNLESTNKEVSRRLVDFLSGVAYANNGQIKRVANSTFIITPYNVDIMGDLLDELEEELHIHVRPLTWPIESGVRFKGVYNIYEHNLNLYQPSKQVVTEKVEVDIHTEELDNRIGAQLADKLRGELELIDGVYPEFDKEEYLKGELAPVFFGSALNNFGVQELLDCFVEIAPSPRPVKAEEREVEPEEPKFTGFIFKITANIDPNHRSCIAFCKICSGKFVRNAPYLHVRHGKTMRFSSPTQFMAQRKTTVDEAWAGDIIGLPDNGTFKIGDTLTEGEMLHFRGLPSFSPEMFKYIENADPMKQKQLAKGIDQLMDEGVAQLFVNQFNGRKIIGTVGQLQFEVIQYRLENEYSAKCRWEPLSLYKACWIESDDAAELEAFKKRKYQYMAKDREGRDVFLADSGYVLQMAQMDFKHIKFHFTSEF